MSRAQSSECQPLPSDYTAAKAAAISAVTNILVGLPLQETAAASASGSSVAAAASNQGSNDKTEQRAIVRAFKRARSSAADKAIMKFFACEGIPFNKARSSWWRELISAVSAAGPGYVPPTYNAMRSTLLDNLKSSTG